MLDACVEKQISLDISPDKMAVYLSITSIPNTPPVTAMAIQIMLDTRGIKQGILNDAIEQAVLLALAQGSAKHILIAEGKKPIPGAVASFQSLIPQAPEKRPKIDEHGNVDYRNLGSMVQVKVGDPLMRKMPASAGEDGYTVLGDILKAKPGKDYPFASSTKGAIIAKDDPYLLVAEVEGQPIIQGRGVSVSPIIEVKNVDLSTGHIQFGGTVLVHGDVKTGMKIQAGNDVFISGTVEAAEINAQGNITIRGGIVGDAKTIQKSTQDSLVQTPRALAFIKAGGNVQAKFIEHSIVEAGVSIHIEESAVQSELIAACEIIVGQNKKGQIIGGQSFASSRIKTHVLGSASEIKTQLRVGAHPFIQQKTDTLKNKITLKKAELDYTQKSLDFMKDNPKSTRTDLRDRMLSTQAKLESELFELEEEYSHLLKHTHHHLAQPCVIAEQCTHGGVLIQIADAKYEVTEKRGPLIFVLRNQHIGTEMFMSGNE